MHNLQRQCNALERDTFDLRDGEWLHALLLSASVQLVAYARLRAPSTTTTLSSSSAGDPLFGELCEASVGVVVSLLDLAAVNHVDYIVDRYRGLAKGRQIYRSRRYMRNNRQQS